MRTALITILRKGEPISSPFGDPGETAKEFKKLCGKLEKNPDGVTEACLWVSDVGISKRRRFAAAPEPAPEPAEEAPFVEDKNSTAQPANDEATAPAAPEVAPVPPDADAAQAATHAMEQQQPQGSLLPPAGETSPAGDSRGDDGPRLRVPKK